MLGLGDRLRSGSGPGEAGEVIAEVREALEMRELQGEGGALGSD